MKASGSARRLAALALVLCACTERSLTGPDAPRGSAIPTADIAAPAGFNGTIRIGVVPAATSVSVGSDGDWVARDKTSGAELLHGAGAEATVTQESVINIRKNFRLQVVSAGRAAVDAWAARAQAASHPIYIEPNGIGGWRLYIGEFADNASFAIRNAYRNQLIAAGLAFGDSFWKVVTIVEGVSRLRVANGADAAFSTGPVVLESTTGRVRIGGQPYRGSAEVVPNSVGTLAGVNVVDIEEYLFGVVPRELPPTIWPEFEAQKAQAVAARTYALAGLGKRKADGYDLLPTTSDQVYGGVAAEHPLSTRAVEETADTVITYGDKLISALFSSTSGGHTANSEEVFTDTVPYLRGVPDAERGRAFEHVPTLEVFRSHPNSRSLRAAKEGDFEADWSQYHRWTFEWTMDEISSVIGAFAGRDVGKVLAINVLERGPSGRVLRIEYVTEGGTFTDTKDRIRSSLKFINSAGTPSSLLSTLFFIEPVRDKKTKELSGFVAYGGGWGHGVGLSQTGAVGMAQKGHSFHEILRHYYQGIEVEKGY